MPRDRKGYYGLGYKDYYGLDNKGYYGLHNKGHIELGIKDYYVSTHQPVFNYN
jgi:hypothetical protein